MVASRVGEGCAVCCGGKSQTKCAKQGGQFSLLEPHLLTAGQSFGEAGVLKQSGKRSSLIIGGPVPELLTVAVQARMARSDKTNGATLAVLSREDYLSVCLASEENIKTVLTHCIPIQIGSSLT